MTEVITALFLERTIARFLARQLESYRLGNVQESIFQEPPLKPEQVDPEAHKPRPPKPEPEEPEEPEEEVVDDLKFKVPPKVIQGLMPKTVTGEVDVSKLPAYPFVSVRSMSGRCDWTGRTPQEICTVAIVIGTYDEDPLRRGYQDCLNLVGAIKQWLPRFRVIDQSFSIVAPLTWEMAAADLFPHFVAEITTQWQLPVPSHSEEVTTLTPYVPHDLADLRKLDPEIYANSD